MDFTQRRRVETQAGRWAVKQSGPAFANPAQRGRRRPRHAGLFEAVRRIDVTADPRARADLAKWVKDEYATEFGDIPLGFLAKCHLGPPFVDHRLDLVHDIVEHYEPAGVVPEPFAQARMLVRTGGYAFVEVYASGELRAVLPDGTVAD